jgi:hypothetical protein
MNWILQNQILVETLRLGQNQFPIMKSFQHFVPLKSIEYTRHNWDQCGEERNDDLAFIGHLSSLTSLYFESGTFIHSEALLSFLQLQSQLEILGLLDTNLSPDTLQMITEYCPNLSHLDLAGNNWVTDEAMTHLTNGSCQRLKHLNLRDTSVFQEATIYHLVSSLPKLSAFYYSPYRYSISTRLMIVRQVYFRSLFDEDPQSQAMALQCLDLHEDLLGQSSLSCHNLCLCLK